MGRYWKLKKDIFGGTYNFALAMGLFGNTFVLICMIIVDSHLLRRLPTTILEKQNHSLCSESTLSRVDIDLLCVKRVSIGVKLLLHSLPIQLIRVASCCCCPKIEGETANLPTFRFLLT
eukprot:scaffold11006_cov194-Alexandrium_tamarense.AAC.7